MQKEIFKKVLQERFSCREFEEKLLSKEELDYILESGRIAPSSLGLEPWRFIVIDIGGSFISKCKFLKRSALKCDKIEVCSLNYFDLKWKIKFRFFHKMAIFSQNITKSITKHP